MNWTRSWFSVVIPSATLFSFCQRFIPFFKQSATELMLQIASCSFPGKHTDTFGLSALPNEPRDTLVVTSFCGGFLTEAEEVGVFPSRTTAHKPPHEN